MRTGDRKISLPTIHEYILIYACSNIGINSLNNLFFTNNNNNADDNNGQHHHFSFSLLLDDDYDVLLYK